MIKIRLHLAHIGQEHFGEVDVLIQLFWIFILQICFVKSISHERCFLYLSTYAQGEQNAVEFPENSHHELHVL